METDGAVSENLIKVDALRFQPLAERFDRGPDNRFRRFKSAMTLRQSNDEVTLVAFAPKFVLCGLEAKKRANGGEQFLGVDRLGQIGVCAPVESCCAILGGHESGGGLQHGDKGVLFLDDSADLEAAHVRELNVADHQYRSKSLDTFEALGTRSGFQDLEPATQKRACLCVTDGLLILDV